MDLLLKLLKFNFSSTIPNISLAQTSNDLNALSCVQILLLGSMIQVHLTTWPVFLIYLMLIHFIPVMKKLELLMVLSHILQEKA